ncbi:MAG: PAS domain-containing protein [Oligoflexia bacterium]|nr:PAS domain-containing protein [Oligoflexia bacterium]
MTLVIGIAASDGSILVLLGGAPDLDRAFEISVLIPLLAAALHNERVRLTAKGQVDTESKSAQRAMELSMALDETRRNLQMSLLETKQQKDYADTEREKFEALFAESPTAMALLRGPTHIFEKVNSVYLQLIGHRDVVGKALLEALPELIDQPFVKQLLDKVYETGETFIGKEINVFLKRQPESSPEDRYFDFTYKRILNAHGKPYGVHINAIDVTDKILDRKKIEDSERQFRTLADSIPQLTWMANGDGWIYWYNQRWYDYTGTTLEEMKGQEWVRVHHPDHVERVVDFISQAWKKNEPWELTFPLKNKNGEWRWFLTRAVPILDLNKKIIRWFGTNTDIDDQVRIQSENEHLLDMSRIDLENLKMEREIREKFVATLSHDLRNPLAAAKLGAQILIRNQPATDSLVQSVSKIVSSLERADMMIQDLLDANRIRSGHKLPIQIESCNLTEVTTATVEELNLMYENRIILRAKKEIRGHWHCQGLRKVIENLANNAVKYGFPKTPVSISLSQINEMVQIAVHNEGKPLTPEEQINIFDSGHRTKSAEKSGEAGWGLGLTLVRGLAEAHGGIVKVESTPSRGVTFVVELPLDSRPFAQEQNSHTEMSSASRPG